MWYLQLTILYRPIGLRMEEKCKNLHCMKRIKELEDELSRLRSVGFDMIKQRGSWQATGTKPDELGLEFNSFFTHEIEDMAEVLVEKSAMANNEARQFLNTTFQGIYESCKESILNRMRDALARILVLPEAHEDDEELYDICRAYGLLLNTSGVLRPEDSQKEVSQTVRASDKDVQVEETNALEKQMSQLAWKLLGMVPPLISATITDAPYCKEWHEKEYDPEWNKDLVDYQLIYYRPVLFFSYEGKVSQKGWIGNRELLDCEKTGMAETACLDPQSSSSYDQFEDISYLVDLKGKKQEDDSASVVHFKSYKKPSLKIQSVDPEDGGNDKFSSISESRICSKAIERNTEPVYHHHRKEDDDKQYSSRHVFGIRDYLY